MATRPLPPENRPRPDDQVWAPWPDSTTRERRTFDAPEESYRHNIIRTWPEGRAGRPVDLVPTPGAEHLPPSALFDDARPAWVIPGVHCFGRLTTVADDAESLGHFQRLLERLDWTWHASVTTSPTRQWVEPGALVLCDDADEVLSMARRQGQAVVQRWDDEGLWAVRTADGSLLHEEHDEGPSVPLVAAPGATGCPLRCGADDWCKRDGGPYGSAAMAAARVFQEHRALLVEAFGCDVCEGGPLGPGHAVGMTQLFTPSREGGWMWGQPLA